MTNLTVSIVNLLFLLKGEPKTRTELYQSGVFFGWKHLHKTINTCKRVGLIALDRLEMFDWDKSIDRRRKRQWWCITSFGLNFLKFFDNEEHPWRIQKFRQEKNMLRFLKENMKKNVGE